MNQPYPNPNQPHGMDEQTARIPQYNPAPPPVAPPKKKRRWPWVVGGLVVLGIFGSAIGGNDEPASVAAADGAAIPAAVAPAAPAPAPAPAVVAPAPAAPARPPVPVAPPAPVEPQMTVSQENALQSAESYLAYTGFSRSGLIDQLEYEGYSTADATFAVDNVTVDWFVEVEQSAESYMDYTSFSRSGLIDQLEYEGFTSEQAAHGANSVGL